MNGVDLMASWLTPTVLFCVLNLMIGTIFITSSLKPQQNQSENDDLPPPPQLARLPSLLDRVKSFNLSRYRSEQTEPIHHAFPAQEVQVKTEHEHEEEPHHVTRTQSDTVAKVEKVARSLKKSASEKMEAPAKEVVPMSRPATVREKTAREEDEAVDEKADDFINKFRQQLKLQRLDSILRYKEMVNRGTRN